jgi:tRNA (guanine37-N1)-methyltransferase
MPKTKITKKEFYPITLFPELFDSFRSNSLMKRAIEQKLLSVSPIDLRIFGEGKHKKCDDKPFAGGTGMVLMVDPIYKAVSKLKSKLKLRGKKHRVILFSTRGTPFSSKEAKRLHSYDALIFICGRYEGVDERVAEHIADEEISMGDFVLSGGELPAMTSIEAVSRFIPGFLGKMETLEEIKGSFPTYTRPDKYKPKGTKKSWNVPEVLLSGNHAKIAQWRKSAGNGSI